MPMSTHRVKIKCLGRIRADLFNCGITYTINMINAKLNLTH